MASRGRIVGQRPDFGKGEQPLRVGFGGGRARNKLWEAGAHQSDRQLTLGGTVQGCDERRQLPLRDVLQLVDEKRERRVLFTRRFPDGLEQAREVRHRDCRYRRDPGSGAMSKLMLEILAADLDGANQPRQRPEGAMHGTTCRRTAAEPNQRCVQRRDKEPRQDVVFRGFQQNRGEPPDNGRLHSCGSTARSFPTPRSPTIRMLLAARPFLMRSSAMAASSINAVATCEFRRWRARARCVRVGRGSISTEVTPSYQKPQTFLGVRIENQCPSVRVA